MCDSVRESVIWRRPVLACVLAICAVTPVLGENPATCSTALNENRATESSTTTGNVASKQASLSCVTESEKTEVVDRFVKAKLATWQRRLKLEDWKVSVTMSRRTDLKPRTLGGIRWDKGKKSAVMAVLDPAEYRLPFREMLADIEFTIVHELVHLELASLPKSEASRSNEEHAVNHLTEALLGLATKE